MGPSSPARDWTPVSCIARWTVNHCTTKEVGPSSCVALPFLQHHEWVSCFPFFETSYCLQCPLAVPHLHQIQSLLRFPRRLSAWDSPLLPDYSNCVNALFSELPWWHKHSIPQIFLYFCGQSILKNFLLWFSTVVLYLKLVEDFMYSFTKYFYCIRV